MICGYGGSQSQSATVHKTEDEITNKIVGLGFPSNLHFIFNLNGNAPIADPLRSTHSAHSIMTGSQFVAVPLLILIQCLFLVSCSCSHAVIV